MAKIIIVDNDRDSADSISRLIKLNHHTVTCFTSGDKMMASLVKDQPDMLIIGVSIDEGDGRELSRSLQTDVLYKDIPVILTSPFYHTESEIRSFYCDDLVSMPFESAKLTASIEALLAKQEAKLRLNAEK